MKMVQFQCVTMHTTENSLEEALSKTDDLWDWTFWNTIPEWLWPSQLLQAILDYIKKMKLSTSAVYTLLSIQVEKPSIRNSEGMEELIEKNQWLGHVWLLPRQVEQCCMCTNTMSWFVEH